METNACITATVFTAYLSCPTKAYLLLCREEPSNSLSATTNKRLSTAYKLTSKIAPSTDFSELNRVATVCKTISFVDAETTFFSLDRLAPAPSVGRIECGGIDQDCVPILFWAWNKLEKANHLLVSFAALAIGHVARNEIPSKGKIVYGDSNRIKNVKVGDYLHTTLDIISAIARECCGSVPPPLVLNKHCSICEFQSRCRKIAIGQEDLSLLGAMTKKERSKCVEKGITTITQLSYGYRPRRRRRVRSTSSPATHQFKHNHKLRALAIKKSQAHVVGSPELCLDGTPVFLDVEGMPDRSSYYLIGVRYKQGGIHVEQSFWANRPEEEQDIWRQCVSILAEIESPRLVHYGAYESRFLKCMRERWTAAGKEAVFVDGLIESSVNLLSNIYGKIYFPTYTNSLKEIANYLGFEWTSPSASGAQAVLLRRCWELTSDDSLKNQLTSYNMEDCRATELIANAIEGLCGNSVEQDKAKIEAVNVSSLEIGFSRTFGKFQSVMPDFDKINSAAYWDYQRSKVYVRTDKVVRKAEKKKKIRKPTSVEKIVAVEERPHLCSKCASSKIWVAQRFSDLVYDLKFTRRGLKRWAVRYHYNSYRCGECKSQVTLYKRSSKYGDKLRAYIIYLLIEMRLSHHQISQHVATVFDIPILGTMVGTIKRDMANRYEPTYLEILHHISHGSVVNVDETKGVVYGGGHYIWVFANPIAVAYVYSASREAAILDEVLGEFDGVLVSDFYGGYDAISCQQQRCLIHLMRDINEEIIKNPFNDELTFIASRFGGLLRAIIETIDRHGLKKFYLRKHLSSVEDFFSHLTEMKCSTEAGMALRKRIRKNQDKLFKFLEFDGVPWNNNNAEHAVRHFTRLRNVMVTSTPKGTKDYCILLSLQQTLRLRGIGFLEFLISSRVRIEGFT